MFPIIYTQRATQRTSCVSGSRVQGLVGSGFTAILGGSRVVISGVISRVTIVNPY